MNTTKPKMLSLWLFSLSLDISLNAAQQHYIDEVCELNPPCTIVNNWIQCDSTETPLITQITNYRPWIADEYIFSSTSFGIYCQSMRLPEWPLIRYNATEATSEKALIVMNNVTIASDEPITLDHNFCSFIKLFKGMRSLRVWLIQMSIRRIRANTFGTGQLDGSICHDVRLDELAIKNNELIIEVENYAFNNLYAQKLQITYNMGLKLHRNSFTGLTVSDIDLSSNNLRSIKGIIFIPLLGTLNSLNLRNNPLRTLDSSWMVISGSLNARYGRRKMNDYLKINTNRLVCDSALNWILHAHCRHALNLKCFNPSAFRGKYLRELTQKDLECANSYRKPECADYYVRFTYDQYARPTTECLRSFSESQVNERH